MGNKYGNVVTTQSLVDEEALLCAAEAHADRTRGPWVGEHKAGVPPFPGGWGCSSEVRCLEVCRQKLSIE